MFDIEDNMEQRHNKLKINMQRNRTLGVPSTEVRGWAVIAAIITNIFTYIYTKINSLPNLSKLLYGTNVMDIVRVGQKTKLLPLEIL